MNKIIEFGKYKGQKVSTIEDDYYLQWLAKPVYSSKFYKSLHSADLSFKVPWEVSVAAREELDKRGYKLVGTRWEK
ncbi:hypothetical protein EHM76_05675 [bacterium]|nr:MAG: hypothetical protein EHM76_05675 [bacterium]